MTLSSFGRGALAAALAALASAASAEPRTVLVLALEDATAPNGLGTYQTVFSRVAASDDGHFAWSASLVGPGSVSGAFVRAPDGSVRTVLDGAAGPAELGGTLDQVLEPDVGDGGEIAFAAFGAEPASLHAWLTEDGTSATLLARQGDPIPGHPGLTWTALSTDVEINDVGQVRLLAPYLDAAVEYRGMFRFDGATPTAIALHGDTPAGVGGDAIQSIDESTGEALSDAGSVAFQATLSPSLRRAILRYTDGAGVEALAIELDPAPVADRVYTFPSISTVTIAADGDVAFVTTLEDPDLVEPAVEAIAVVTGAGAQIVLQEGDAAPGGGAFTQFAAVALDDAGAIAFLGVADDGTPRQGVYLLRGGAVEVIAREGDPAPSIVGAATYQGFSVYSIRLTENGDVTFRASLSDGRGGFFVSTPLAAVPSAPPAPLALALALAGAAALVRGSARRATVQRRTPVISRCDGASTYR